MPVVHFVRKRVGSSRHKPVGIIPHAATGACRAVACYAFRVGTILSRREPSLPYSNPIMESRKVRWMTRTVFPDIAWLPSVAFTAGVR